MTRLQMPVKITITVESADGTVRTHNLSPGANLTMDGVSYDFDRKLPDPFNPTDHITYTTRTIRWTEMEFEK